MAAFDGETFFEDGRADIREKSPQIIEPLVVEHGQRASDLKVAIHEKKCVEQSGFMREEQRGGKCVGRVIVGKEDVVKVDVGARSKAGQHFQNDEVQFAGGGKSVAGIDKEEIPGAQPAGTLEAGILHLLRDEFDAALLAFALEKGGREGLDADNAW